jgi:hypothetical protein
MRKQLASSVAVALALAVFSGAAVAGNGNGNGHEGDSGSSDGRPAQSKDQQPAAAPANSEGVKPSNDTQKDTSARADSNKTKEYGNGQTAGQIATSRGASGDTLLHGPGNSQPHKVLACGKNHEVDVHAIKSYSDATCQVAEIKKSDIAAAPPAKEQTDCTKSVTVTVPAGVWHRGSGEYVRLGSDENSAEGSDDLYVSSATTKTVVVNACGKSDEQVHAAAFEVAVGKCGHPVGELGPANVEQKSDVAAQSQSTPAVLAPAVHAAETPAPVVPAQAVPPATPATGGVAGVAGTLAPVTPATRQAAPAAAQPAGSAPQGGVLGAQATIAPKAKPAGGVLGTTARVASTRLPFTGIALWVVAIVAGALVAAGLTLRRAGR